MKAQPGDWLVVHSHIEGRHDRRAEDPGEPDPTASRRSPCAGPMSEHEGLFFPGPDSQILTPAEQAAHAQAEAELIDRVQATIGRTTTDR